MSSPGSDCPKGKTQYATKKIAMGAAADLRRRQRRGKTANAYEKCPDLDISYQQKQ